MASYKQLMRLVKMRKALPGLYYAVREDIERGKVCYIEETDFTPECIICHPDDLEELKTLSRPLVSLSEWRPTVTILDTPTNKKLEPSPKHPTPPPETGPLTGPSPVPPKVGERKRGKK